MSLSRHAWLVSMALAACAAPAQWERPGGGATGMQQDSEQCRAQARAAPPLPSLTTTTPSSPASAVLSIDEYKAREAQAFQKCMADKGYSAKR